MKLKLTSCLVITLLILGINIGVFAQDPVFEKSVCLSETNSEYTNAEYRATKSDGICNSGTQLRHFITGDANTVESVELQRLNVDDTGHRVKVQVNWEEGMEGVVLIEVQFRNRYHDSWGDCDWAEWTTLYFYRITRQGMNPGGTLEGNSIFSTNDNQLIDIDLVYEKSSDYPHEVDEIKVWINGRSVDGGSRQSGQSSIPLTYNLFGENFGDYTFTTEVKNNCEQWMPGPTKTISVKPSCWDDNPADAHLLINDLDPIPSSGYRLEKERPYTINYAGITDFNNHYDLQHDGGSDITLSGNSFTVHAGLGSYRIEAVPKSGRDECSVIEPLSIFVGGQDEVFEQPCLISLPQDLINFGYELVDGEPALQHFAATVRSEKGFVIKPGITLSMGAELILDYEEPMVDENELNPDMNFIQTTSYDEYNRVAEQSRQFFNEEGKLIQLQYKDLTRDVLMATQTIYDAFGRAVINTLPAPVEGGTYEEVEDECGDQEQRGAKIRFAYKPDFVTDQAGNSYNHTHFDLDMEQQPEPLGNDKEGSLGWYYSHNNGSSTNERINEHLVAITNYPYSRVLFHHDGSGEVKSTTNPGDAFRAGSGHLGENNRERVNNDDPFLKDYLEIRASEVGLKFAAGLTYEGNFFRNVSIDAEDKKAVSYQDLAGNTIISLYFGSQSSPITRNYQFFNDRGQLLESLSPNGWQQYKRGTDFSQVDKTVYTYDAKGRMVAMTETDAGHTEYVYRKDGKIRFSQNVEQKVQGSFSYTNYDFSGRPVESGEYTPGAITFKSDEMENILEVLHPEDGLSDNSGTMFNRVFTYYDHPDPECPQGRKQRFVHGTVSYTEKENTIKTWYSYDEQGRVDWLVRQIDGFDTKNIDYRYGPTGAVQEVAYQKGNPEEDFYHFYEYDRDGRLATAYTATEELLYNQYGELTNRAVLKEQVSYEYYLHGPLKRVELAEKLQGIDYTYTANGALKGINHADIDNDPGKDGDGNGFREDLFGMTLDYYNNDYQGAGYSAGTLSLSGVAEQFSGNIRAQSWHSPVDGGERVSYAYSYDERYQLQEARWGNHTGEKGAYGYSAVTNNAFQESIPSYDLNGNIDSLTRKDEFGVNVANFNYQYETNTNKLSQVKQGDAVFRDYEYNKIGQLARQSEGDENIYLQYDVTGKVTGLYLEYDAGTQEYTHPITTFSYDDSGFRLSKITYDKDGNEQFTTWYVRDASGSLLSTYIQKGFDFQQEELPIYGAGKVGVYRPNAIINKLMYEITDHLGNVRAVVGEPVEVEYIATMETESSEVEGKFFDNIDPVMTDEGFINHTPSSVTLNGMTYDIESPNQVIRINNALDNPKKVIGGAIMLPVSAGDEVSTEVFVKYLNFNKGNTNILPGLATYLGSAFGMPGGGDGLVNIFEALETPGTEAFNALGNVSEEYPRIFLNYILFDKNFMIQDFGLTQITDAAEIPEANPELHPHERLDLEIAIKKGGYIYIYVSNDDGQNMDAYFDDFRVLHKYSDVVAGSDYYPFGLAIESRENTREDYHYGYQGKFAEKDEETGWNSFELRQYDPVVGRWTSVDPERQYASPFVGMGNNPVSRIDPDGGFDEWNILPNGERVWVSDKGGANIDYFNYYSTETFWGRNFDYYTHTEAVAKSFAGLIQLGSSQKEFYLGVTIEADRFILTDQSTISSYTIDGSNSGYFLEPRMGTPTEAQTEGSNTAITAGTYYLNPHNSSTYRNVYRLIDVQGRTAVLIHGGNYPADTRACLLPGCNIGTNYVGPSGPQLNEIRSLLNDNNYGSRIIIRNPIPYK